jgi:hypothetical protein
MAVVGIGKMLLENQVYNGSSNLIGMNVEGCTVILATKEDVLMPNCD